MIFTIKLTKRNGYSVNVVILIIAPKESSDKNISVIKYMTNVILIVPYQAKFYFFEVKSIKQDKEVVLKAELNQYKISNIIYLYLKVLLIYEIIILTNRFNALLYYMN